MCKAAELANLIGNINAGGGGVNRNVVINGAMNVAQRTTSETGLTGSDNRITDKFMIQVSSLGTWTMTQESDAPDGFANSLKLDCTTADASPASGDYFYMHHRIEGNMLQHFAYGTSDAKPITLSFYVKSNKTGTGTVNILQPDNSYKQVSPTYTINSANTWERKTVTIAGDTSGVINDDNGRGMELEWWLNSGSNYTSGSNLTTYGTFSNTNRNVSNLGIGGSTDDFWSITGIQLEVGQNATEFEHEPFDVTLNKCYRYFQKFTSSGAQYQRFGVGLSYSSTAMSCPVFLMNTMRDVPSVGTTGTASNYAVNHNNDTVTVASSVPAIAATGDTPSQNIGVTCAVSGGLDAGDVSMLISNNNTDSFLSFDAEVN